MTRSTSPLIPRSLEDPGPHVAHCPEICCFRLTCPEPTQIGMAEAWSTGQLTRREDCLWFQHLAALHYRELGLEPPADAAAFLEQLRTIKVVTVLDE